MEQTFEQLKTELLVKAKAKGACADQYKRAAAATNETDLLKVIYENVGWCLDHQCISNAYLIKFTPEILLASGLANTGKENTGVANSGDRNSGDRNSGDSNSGYRNSGNWNSGYRNSGNWNSGDRNSGDSNSGYRNSGDRNSGNWNSGDRNSGDRNSGDRNSGDRNSGDSNSGYRNSGDRNSGNWNSGDRNSGDSNSGNWNSGDRNSGDSNSGYRNSGAFCTDANPPLILFNKVSKMSVKEWEQHECCQMMYAIDPTIWVPSSIMTDEEKAAHPKHETTEGYLKTIPLKEAWANFWHNLAEDKKQLFLSLENFDAAIFEEITGVNVNAKP
jgi:hypothetical protein